MTVKKMTVKKVLFLFADLKNQQNDHQWLTGGNEMAEKLPKLLSVFFFTQVRNHEKTKYPNKKLIRIF